MTCVTILHGEMMTDSSLAFDELFILTRPDKTSLQVDVMCCVQCEVMTKCAVLKLTELN